MEVYVEWGELAGTLKAWLAAGWNCIISLLAAMAEDDNRIDTDRSLQEY